MDRTKIIDNYMSSYNEIVEKYEKEKIANYVDEINTAIKKGDTSRTNIVYEKISIWNNLVSNLQGSRDALVTYDKSLRLPSVREFLIIYDHINKEWKFNTDLF